MNFKNRPLYHKKEFSFLFPIFRINCSTPSTSTNYYLKQQVWKRNCPFLMNRGSESTLYRNSVLELFSALVAKQKLSLIIWKTVYENLIESAIINSFQDTHSWRKIKFVFE